MEILESTTGTKRGYAATKDQLRKRLAGSKARPRGVARIIEEDRYCIDVLTQVDELMNAVGRLLRH